MKKSLGCIIAFVVVALIIAVWAMGQYNGLVQSREAVNTAWAQVENVYQRRMDLIPNLVATVKGVAAFEKDTYIAVAEARAKAGQIKITPEMLNDPAAFKQFEASQAALGSALSRLLAVAENYPQLKANQNFLELQSQLEGTENRIAVERRKFNEVAQGYNTKIKSFPANLLAGLFGFRERPYFSAAPGAEKAPEVKF
ncbi:LemA family protein [bacterium]|jgi:LemA protein|nr:LemA family protein [bacterium]